jgi:peptidyl-prolyl cis-trans isomerase C/foldase protein PrsA
LTLEEFNASFEPVRMNYSKEDTGDIREARNRYLLQMLEEMIILRRAEELNMTIDPEELSEAIAAFKTDYSENSFEEMLLIQAISFDVWQNRLRKQLLVKKVIHHDLENGIVVSPEDIRAFYDAHQTEWHRGKGAHVFQILVADKKEAKALLQAVKEGGDFAEIARKHSIAPEAVHGGDMGFIQEGELPEELERPIFETGEGKISRIVESAFGFHIFKIVEKRKAGKPTMDDLIEEIRKRVKENKVKEAYGPWLAKLRSRYDVTINEQII